MPRDLLLELTDFPGENGVEGLTRVAEEAILHES